MNNILILTDGDIISTIAINKIAEYFCNSYNVYIVVDKYKNESKNKLKINKLEILDISSILYRIITFFNKKFRKNGFYSLNKISKLKNVYLQYTNNINHDEKLIQNINPELILSIRLRNILKDNIIKFCNCPIYNLHSGILPNFRGTYSLLRAINQGYTNFGCTLHTIENEKIDMGKIILKTDTKIDFNKSYFWNTLNIYINSIDEVNKKLEFLLNNKNYKIEKTNQNNKGTYYSFPTDNDVKIMQQKVKNIITINDILYILFNFL